MADRRQCEVVECGNLVKAQGLCNKHYQRSKRRYDRADRPDGWDWTAGATTQSASKSCKETRGQRPTAGSDFTGAGERGRGGLRGSLPPGETSSETETGETDDERSAAPPNLQIAIDLALATLPAAVQASWQAAAVRLLAETLEEARWAENAQPSAAAIRELWARMSALEEAYTEQETDAIDAVAAVLLERLAATEDSEPPADH